MSELEEYQLDVEMTEESYSRCITLEPQKIITSKRKDSNLALEGRWNT
jgi:hypothetical protein